MKKLILPLLLLLSSTGLAQSLGRYNNWCEEGGQIVVLQGLNSVTNVQQSAPMCTVEVFLSGTNTHASLFADNSGSPTPLSNPFTASTTGQFGFYATPGVFYDVVTSNGIPTLPSTVTYPYVIVSTPGTGTGTVTGFSSGNLSPLFTTSVATASSTPALTFTLSNANAHKWFGNNTGSTAAPGYETIGTADLPFTYSGNTTELMTAGTVSGTGSTLCTDASGNATTVGCSGGGGGISGSGTSGTFTIWTGTSTVGNSVLTNVTGPPAGINYNLGGGLSWQIDASHITFNSGVSGNSNVVIANTYSPGSGNNSGGINIVGANASGSASAGSITIIGGSTSGGADNNGSTIVVGGGAANGFGATGSDISLTAGSTSHSNGGGSIHITPGSGNFGNGSIFLGVHNGALPVVVWADGSSSNTLSMQMPTLSSSWSLTWPVNAGTANFLFSTNGSGVTSWVAPDPITTANCAASGTGANPSVVACGAAKAGAIYCDVAASTGTCQINTTAVTAASEIFVFPNTSEGTRLSKTCNTAPSAPPAILLVSKSAGNNFIINMSTVTTNGECYDYLIVN